MNKRDYVHHDIALMRSLPVFPGAVRMGGRSFASFTPDTDNSGRPIGYATLAVYRVPRGTRAAAVVRFYRSRLEALGWRGSLERIPEVNGRGKRIGTTLVEEFMRGGASVGIDTGALAVRSDIPVQTQHIGWTYELTVDRHASG